MSQQSDNVIRVAFSGTAWENHHEAAEDEVDPEQEIRAIIQCLRYLQEQAGRIEHTTAANLIGAAARALDDAERGGAAQ